MKPFSNAQVSKLVGIHPITLERWLASGELPWPKVVVSNGQVVRLWNEADVRRLCEYKTRTAAQRAKEGKRPRLTAA